MVGLFFTTQAVLEGKGLGEARRRIESSWAPTLYKNWGLFSPSPSSLLLPSIPLQLMKNDETSPGSTRQLLHRTPSPPPCPRQRRLPFLEVRPLLLLLSAGTRLKPSKCSAYLSYANSASGGVDRELEDVVTEGDAGKDKVVALVA